MSVSFGETLALFPRSIPRQRIVLPRRDHRAWKRRRLKALNVRCLLNPTPSPFEDLFQSLLSQISSVNSLGFVAPALGLVSGLALFFTSNSTKLLLNPSIDEISSCDIGEWILFTSPTPFNCFVTLRCPSICFPGDENLSEKLLKEDMHYVKFNAGRMVEPLNVDDDDGDEDIEFQRICLSTSDVGILSLDWPATLDMEEELGLDTTIFIVPGTEEGSKEKNIMVFVSDCLRRGTFPVVMNPRGCAGSPLTTARLFTAADSDDVLTAVQFINKKRPLSTLMGVGFGYGANMLTKHLAECGVKTPFTAVTCIDSPFDLEEVTRSFYHKKYYLRLTSGLIKILQNNKELFQGRSKGFDIERALSASSIRDFDKAISIVSNGFDTVTDFYAKCSTRDEIGKLEVPVLFIQNDDGKVPMFSVPRGLIAENPYASLLLCAFSPSREASSIDDHSFSWCHHLTLEWLAAVELGLLKGRHPLLRDIDINISPSKSLLISESTASSKRGGNVDKQLKPANKISVTPTLDIPPADDMTISIQSTSEDSTWESFASKKALHTEANNDDQSSSTIDPVVQAAEVVLNMLDVTLPDTLTDEQKKRVLNSVGQGETLLQALHDAVPEEVRGKLTSAVSGILQSHGSDIKFGNLLRLGDLPGVSSRLSFDVLEKIKQATTHGSKADLPHHNDLEITHSSDETVGDVNFLEKQPEVPPDPKDAAQQFTSHHLTGISNLNKENPGDLGKFSESEALSDRVPSQVSGAESSGIVDSKQALSSTSEVTGEVDGTVSDPKGVVWESGNNHSRSVEVNNHHENFPTDVGNLCEAHHNEDQSSDATAVAEAADSEAGKNQRKEGGFLSSGDSTRFSVSQAIDALTGLDDSTQVAVNSVFHVIEGMIDKMDVEKDKENGLNNENSSERTAELSEDAISTSSYSSRKTLDIQLKTGRQSDHFSRHGDGEGSRYRYENQNSSRFQDNAHSSLINDMRSQFKTEDEIQRELTAWSSANNGFQNFLSYLATQTRGDWTYKDHLKYLYLKARNALPPGIDRIPALYLHYFPDEDKWKLLDPSEENIASVKKYATGEAGCGEDFDDTNSTRNHSDRIEHIHGDMDPGKSRRKNAEGVDIFPDNFEFHSKEFDDCKVLIKNITFKCLKAEVNRRINMSSLEEMGVKLSREIEYVANVVSMEAVQVNDDSREQKIGNFGEERIAVAILSAIKSTDYLRRVLPAGVLVGTCIVELRKFFSDVDSLGSNEGSEKLIPGCEIVDSLAKLISEEDDSSPFEHSQNNAAMVGAVTAALGSSAFLAHKPNTKVDGTLNVSHNEKEITQEPSKLDEENERSQNNIVTNLAEKAMSVASPMVPMKEDGQLDQERMVAMLTELGQKGGFLKFFGKVALLWGGIRGAMSLADKLILFLRIAERPLFQRIIGFAFMVLLLWSPVVLPLLPSLMQSWATHKPFKVAEFSCIAGLYISTLIMITLWGKRIRKYDDPLMQYGLNLTSASEFQTFLKGLIGGIALILVIHTTNSLIGCASVRWPTVLSSSAPGPVALIGSYAWILLFIVQGLATATGASVVEELLFRSWLPQEIAADLGHHYGIVISGLIFALSQRSNLEIPGLLLLSICLSGARQRSGGSLSLPIGFRTGIIASNFVLKTGGFLNYHPSFPMWVTGGQPCQPFSGVVGLAFSFILAVILYPRQLPHHKKPNRIIRP